MNAGGPVQRPGYRDPVQQLGLGTAAELDAAEREITHCLRGLRRDAFVGRLAHYLGEVNALHPFREGSGRAQRAFFGRLARDAGLALAWQHLDPARNVEASAAIMRGDPEPIREMLDSFVRDSTDHTRSAMRRAAEGRSGSMNRSRPEAMAPREQPGDRAVNGVTPGGQGG